MMDPSRALITQHLGNHTPFLAQAENIICVDSRMRTQLLSEHAPNTG